MGGGETRTTRAAGVEEASSGVDHAGVIVAQALTDSAVDDASAGIDLIETIASSARTVTADAAYDTLAFYETAKLSRRKPRSSARDGTIRKISRIGRHRWKKEVRLSSTGPRRESVLPVQVDSRRSTSKSDSRSAGCRGIKNGRQPQLDNTVRHRSIENDSGRPSSVIRLSTLHASTDSSMVGSRRARAQYLGGRSTCVSST